MTHALVIGQMKASSAAKFGTGREQGMWLGWDMLQETSKGTASSCHVEALPDLHFKAPQTL